MIDREYARRIAQEDLDHRYSERLVVSGVEEHELVWVVYYETADYLRTREDPWQRLGGNGPYLVDRIDGGLHQIGPVSHVTGAWETDYRRRIRKEPTRTAVDDLHDEVRQAVGRGRGWPGPLPRAGWRAVAAASMSHVSTWMDEMAAVSESRLRCGGAMSPHAIAGGWWCRLVLDGSFPCCLEVKLMIY
ncbi:YrhB domain-containing protein [Streptomyces sp. NPDC057620]|uniref:YrhB domain-containing protein n=1 Tax=Streptomyces sp. NPDC057620 TaxID=3346185 RepID=UPI0036D15D07